MEYTKKFVLVADDTLSKHVPTEKQKRTCEEFFSPSKRQCLETFISNEPLDLNFEPVDDLTRFNNIPEITSTCDDTQSFSNTHVNDFFNKFFNDFNSEFPTNDVSTSMLVKKEIKKEPMDDEIQDLANNNFFNDVSTSMLVKEEIKKEPMDDEIQNLANNKTQDLFPPNIYTSELPIASLHNKSSKNLRSVVFQTDLGDYIFLTLLLRKSQYFIQIKEFKHNRTNDELISNKSGICMNISTWFEFQYKLFAFNLRYKSSSFIANNIILVLNQNNSMMQIKHLKNYAHVELNNLQLQNLKEMAFDLNKRLLDHMFTKQIPNLIKHKGVVNNLENEDVLMTKLILCIEENMVNILNRIYECRACIEYQTSLSLHICFIVNNREKFQQLGEMVLMLIDQDFVVSTFLNRVECISENFLCNINVETIKNLLFKTAQ